MDVEFTRGGRLTMEWWKCYLDSCVSYHTFFVREFLQNIHKGRGTMTGNCNEGTTRINKRGSYGDFQVWLNKKGTANLIYPCARSMWVYCLHSHEWRVESSYPPGGCYSFQATHGTVCWNATQPPLRARTRPFEDRDCSKEHSGAYPSRNREG